MGGVRGILGIFSVFIICEILFFHGTFAIPTEPGVRVEQEPEVPCSENVTSLSLDIETTDTELFQQGRQYKFHSTPLSWLESVIHCWRNGGQLAVPHSTEEAKALADLLIASAGDIDESATIVDAIHVAVHNLRSEPLWTTLEGRKLSETGYDLWMEGGNGKCVSLFADGRFFQQSCATKLAFICESVTPKNTQITRNYTLIPGIGRFRLYESPLVWPQAQRHCEAEGGSLAVPQSGRAAGLLAGTMLWRASPSARSRGCFVGVTDIVEEGQWTTVKGEKLTSSSYSEWRYSEPSGNRSENCVILMEDGLYADYPCLSPLAYCCEISEVGPSGNSKNVLIDDGYQFNATPLTWLEAAVACHEQNMSLAVPRETRDHFVLNRLISSANSRFNTNYNEIYVGIHRMNEDNEWTSINDDIYSNRRRITYTVHDYYGGQGGCAFYRNKLFYKRNCFEKLPYACE